MSLGHFLDVYNGLARCSPVLHYIGKTGFFVFVMLGKKGRERPLLPTQVILCCSAYQDPTGPEPAAAAPSRPRAGI